MIDIKKIDGCKLSDDKRHMHLRLIAHDGRPVELALPQGDLYKLLSFTIRCNTLAELALGLRHTTFLDLTDGDAVAAAGEIALVLQIADHRGIVRFHVPPKAAEKLSRRLAEAKLLHDQMKKPH